ncbi:hypothetical protein CKAH01_01252 [Colletotrichum kahawae]|uniref:Uncharacterized protein n=1 Tax=Colletotrichum kahawae TaxID=34407 RepID=A0AAD9YCI6_COLKA|nr:hypothetical protein CKAH01_01252 [Colletotrichum kahawae]
MLMLTMIKAQGEVVVGDVQRRGPNDVVVVVVAVVEMEVGDVDRGGSRLPPTGREVWSDISRAGTPAPAPAPDWRGSWGGATLFTLSLRPPTGSSSVVWMGSGFRKERRTARHSTPLRFFLFPPFSIPYHPIPSIIPVRAGTSDRRKHHTRRDEARLLVQQQRQKQTTGSLVRCPAVEPRVGYNDFPASANWESSAKPRLCDTTTTTTTLSFTVNTTRRCRPQQQE